MNVIFVDFVSFNDGKVVEKSTLNLLEIEYEHKT